MIQLGDSFDTYGKRLQSAFTDDLSQALDAIFTKAKTTKEALQDLALSFVRQIGSTASKNLSEMIVGQIAGTTASVAPGGGSRGIFDWIGTALGTSGRSNKGASKSGGNLGTTVGQEEIEGSDFGDYFRLLTGKKGEEGQAQGEEGAAKKALDFVGIGKGGKSQSSSPTNPLYVAQVSGEDLLLVS